MATKRATRFVLLTSKERDRLSKKSDLSTVQKYKLTKRLKEKFPQMVEDLEIIATSEILMDWRSEMRDESCIIDLENLVGDNSFFPISEKIHDGQFVKSIRNNEVRYWLEYKEVTKPTRGNFNPKYVLRNLKAKKETKQILLNAYRYGVCPINEENALTVQELETRIKEKRKSLGKKRKSLEEKQISPIYYNRDFSHSTTSRGSFVR